MARKLIFVHGIDPLRAAWESAHGRSPPIHPCRPGSTLFTLAARYTPPRPGSRAISSAPKTRRRRDPSRARLPGSSSPPSPQVASAPTVPGAGSVVPVPALHGRRPPWPPPLHRAWLRPRPPRTLTRPPSWPPRSAPVRPTRPPSACRSWLQESRRAFSRSHSSWRLGGQWRSPPTVLTLTSQYAVLGSSVCLWEQCAVAFLPQSTYPKLPECGPNRGQLLHN